MKKIIKLKETASKEPFDLFPNPDFKARVSSKLRAVIKEEIQFELSHMGFQVNHLDLITNVGWKVKGSINASK